MINQLRHSLLVALTLLSWGGGAAAQVQEDNAGESTAQAASQAQPMDAMMRQKLELETMALLAKSQPRATVRWLKSGDSPFLALYLPASTPTPNGVVVMLPGAGEHADWPGTFSTLRNYLPKAGWSTLAITLPPPDLAKPPAVKPTTPAAAEAPTPPQDPAPKQDETKDIFDSAGNTITDGTIDFVAESSRPEPEIPGMAEEVAMDRIIATLSFVQEMGNTPVILYGQGLGATRAAEYLFDHGDPNRQIQALLLVTADNRIPGKAFKLIDGLNDPALPVFDIFPATAKTDADIRGDHARAKELTGYRQLEIAIVANNEANIARHIHGFLHARLGTKP